MFGIAEHLGKRRKHVSMENVSSKELCCFKLCDVRVVWSGLRECPWDVTTSTVRPQGHLRHAIKNCRLSRSTVKASWQWYWCQMYKCQAMLLSDLLDIHAPLSD